MSVPDSEAVMPSAKVRAIPPVPRMPHASPFPTAALTLALLLADRCLEGQRRTGGLQGLVDLLWLHTHGRGQFVLGGLTAQLCAQTLHHTGHLAQRLGHVRGQADGAALVREGACDGLAN